MKKYSKIHSIQWHWFHAWQDKLSLLFSSKQLNGCWKFMCWVWIWTLVQISSNPSVLIALAQITACCMSWSCIILRIALIVFFLCSRCLSPLSRRGFDDVINDTDEELYYLQKWQASKTPLFIPIQSQSLTPALFYCIRTTPFQLLHAAVAEPLSCAWPIIATVNRWNPLAWGGVVWALLCLLIHACLSCLLFLRVVSGLIHRGWIGMWWRCPTVGS